MFKNKNELAFHSLGILFCLFSIFCIFKVSQLYVVPWLIYFIFFIGPASIYLMALFHPNRQKTAYIVFLVCALLYLVTATFVVDSSAHVKSRSDLLLIPFFMVLHYLLLMNFRILHNRLKILEIVLVVLSLATCNLILFLDSQLWSIIVESIVLTALLILKIYGIYHLKDAPETINS